jgi:hypothetical protein
MKLVTLVLLAVALGLLGALQAAEPAGSSQTALSFAGGSVWNSDYSVRHVRVVHPPGRGSRPGFAV